MRNSPRRKSGGWCREALVECAGYARTWRDACAAESQPLIKDHRDVLRMVREVNSPHLKICLDAPLMPTKPRRDARGCQAGRLLQIMSHFGGEFDRNPDGSIIGVDRIDGIITGETNQYYRDFTRAMHEIGYHGYTSYELCHQLPV